MPRIDNHQFYHAALSRHGATHQALHWNTLQSQQTRFKALIKLFKEPLASLSIVDAGCGFGDFYTFCNPYAP